MGLTLKLRCRSSPRVFTRFNFLVNGGFCFLRRFTIQCEIGAESDFWLCRTDEVLGDLAMGGSFHQELLPGLNPRYW